MEPVTVDAAVAIAPERDIAFDMVRRSLPLAPALLLLGGAFWGVNGALSSAFALALVLVNFVVSAALLGWAARRSPALVMATALGGFAARMGLILLAVLAIKDQAWVESVPLSIALLASHLGLLVWETRHVSASLAFPGLKPPAPEKGA